MKIKFLLFLCFSTTVYSFAQSFVNTQNKWHIADCCSSIFQSENDCTNYEYTFGDTVMIDSLSYRPLITENLNPLFELGAYYREENGKVYLKNSMSAPEKMIYDFSLEIGAIVTLNEFDFLTDYEVLEIDSIDLESGVKRKRLALGAPSTTTPAFYWIEGLGMEYAPLNPEFRVAIDCWNRLRCYYVADSLEFRIGDCMLGDETISTYELASEQIDFSIIPNPVESEFTIETTFDQINNVQIYNNLGAKAMKIDFFDSNTIQVNHLTKGIYYLVVQFDNGLYKVEKFIKF